MVNDVVVNLSANIAQLKAGLAGATSSIKSSLGDISGSLNDVKVSAGGVKGSISNVVSTIGSVPAVTALAVTGITAAIGAMVSLGFEAINTADNLRDLSLATGKSIGDLQALQVIAEKNGTTAEAMQASFDFVTRGMAKGDEESSKFARALDHFGVSMTDANGKLKTSQQVAQEVAEAYMGSTKSASDQAAAQDTLGKSFLGTIGGLSQLNTLQQEKNFLEETGAQVSQAQADASDDYNDTLVDLRSIMQGVGNFVASTMLPLLQGIVSQFKESATNGGILEGVINVLKVAFVGITAIGKGMAAVFIGIDTIFQGLGKTIAGVLAMLANPGNAGAIWDQMKADINKLVLDSGERINKLFSDIKTGAQTATQEVRNLGTYTSTAPKTPRKPKVTKEKEPKQLTSEQIAAKVEADKEQHRREQAELDAYVEKVRQTEQKAQLIRNEAARDGAVARLDIKSKENQQLVALGEMTVQQQLEAERSLNEQRYQIQLEAVEEQGRLAQELADKEHVRVENLPEYQEYLAAKQALDEEYTARKLDLNNQIQLQEKQIGLQLRSDIKGSFENFFTSILDGTKSISEAFKDLGSSILKTFTDLIAKKLAQSLFDSLFGKGSLGGGFLDLFGGLFGGKRAGGGSTAPGKWYMVGERGPELLRTGTFGNITPNSNLQAMTSVTPAQLPPINFQIPPSALNMTLKDWFEGEIARIQATS